MYDNIDFYLSNEDIGYKNLLESVPKYLNNISQTCFENGKCQITGYLEGMKVQVSEKGLNFKNNSFCKWYLGNNVETMTRLIFKEGVQKLNDGLHLPVNKAKVSRVDLATNLITNEKPVCYFPYLGELKYFNRSIIKSSLYYNQGNGQLIFYDKVLDYNSKKLVIPPTYGNRNLLRYERRFKRYLCKKLDIDKLLLESLYQESIYTKLKNQWYSDYVNIFKIKENNNFDYRIIKTKSELGNQGLLIYIENRGGLINVLAEVKNAQNIGLISRKQAQDLRDKYKEVSSNILYLDNSDLIIELDFKMKEMFLNIE